MGHALAIATPGVRVGIVVVALLAAGVVLLPRPRARAAALVGTLVLTPVLLIAEVADTPQFGPVRDHPALTAALAAVALALVIAGAVGLARRPSAFPLAALAALPFRVPIEAGGQTSNLLVPLYLVVAAGALAVVGRALRAPRPGDESRPQPRRPGRLEIALVGFVVLYAVQGLYSTDASNALRQVVFFYVPFVLLFTLLSQVRWTRRLVVGCLGVVAGLALAFTLIGFVEYATHRILLNPKVIQANEFDTYFRVNSLFFDPNVYGRFLALVMLALAAVAIWTRRPRRLAVAVVMLAILWGGLLLTFSQSSFAALLAGLAVLAALRWSAHWAVGLTVAAAAVAAVVLIAVPGVLGVRLDGARGLNHATDGRVSLVRGGVSLFTARPLAGWGAGSFSHEYRVQRKASNARALSASHTTPITIAAEQGAIGLLAYLAVLVAALSVLLPGARRRPARAALAAAFLALIVHTLFYADFFEDPVTWALLGIGLALGRQGGMIGAPVEPAAQSAAPALSVGAGGRWARTGAS